MTRVRGVGVAILFAISAVACGHKTPPATPGAAAGQAQAPEPIFDVTTSQPRASCGPAAKDPPPNSPPLVRCIEWQFHPVNQGLISQDTYAYYTKTQFSLPSQDKWVPYNEDTLQADFTSLLKTNFLDNIWIQVVDEPFDNGVAGKHIVYHLEERPKLKGIEYTGSKIVEISKIDEELKKKGIDLRLDSFVDQSTITRVKNVVKDMYAAEGYQYADVKPTLTPVQGVTKLVVLDFEITQGPQVRIQHIVFDGAKDFKNGKLEDQMKDNKPAGLFGFITGGGKYQESKFGDDVQRVQDFYRENGYMQARLGLQKLEVVGDSKDGKTRWVRIHVPVDEGMRFKLGKLTFSGNTAVRTEAIQKMFKAKEGQWIDWKKMGKAIEKIQDAYGSFGYFHWTADPVIDFPGQDKETLKPIDPAKYQPIANVTVNIIEGKQFFVNRITFAGNTTTHDTVVRREIQLYEGGVFNVERLKSSVRRLNQLGYFKPLESDEAVKIEETPGMDGKVDVRLKFEEQNRNQITFGAGVSQIDGFFGQLSFSTSNFLGRGESLGVQLQKGSQARNYAVSFTEPFLFDRPISAGVTLFSRSFIYPGQYTINSTGGSVMTGYAMTGFTRLFMAYSLEQDTVPRDQINPIYLTPAALISNPFLADSLLLNTGGKRTIGKISPSVVYDTVNSPIFPDQGTRLTSAFDLAGVGGNTKFWQTRLEGLWLRRVGPRQSIGVRLQGQYITPYGGDIGLPIFTKLFLGGEYTVRGFDLRTIGPRDPATNAVVGGNKTLLFNGEYMINVGGPVRAVFFYDAGEVRDIGQPFALWDPINQTTFPQLPLLIDPTAGTNSILFDPNNPRPGPVTTQIGKASAIKTSTGLEMRVFMPVLNVPFRLIFAYNPQRFGVLNENLQLTKAFVVKFAVGTTF